MIAPVEIDQYTQFKRFPRRNTVSVTPRHFAQRLNQCLDETEAPSLPRERANILSKMLDIPKQQAHSLLEGQFLPEDDLISRIASEFEVECAWLTGDK